MFIFSRGEKKDSTLLWGRELRRATFEHVIGNRGEKFKPMS